MDADLYDSWLKAIETNDVAAVEATLAGLNEEKKKGYLNGYFVFMPHRLEVKDCPCEYDEGNNYTFPHAFHMAVAFASFDVVSAFISHGADVCVVNEHNYNVLHLLSYMACMKDNEEEMVRMYRRLKESVSHDTMRQLLHQENKEKLRPLEYALGLSISGVAKEILDTQNAFVVKEECTGTTVTKMADVSEYEAGRIFLSPPVLLVMFDRRKIGQESFKQLFFSDVLQTWIKRKNKAMLPFVVAYFLFRVVFMTCAYFGDFFLSVQEELYLKDKNVSTGNGTCLDLDGNATGSWGMVMSVLVYSVGSLGLNVLEMWYFVWTSRPNAWTLRTPNGSRNAVAHFLFYRFNQIFLHIIIVCNFIVRSLRIFDLVTISFTFDNITYVLFSSSLAWSIMQFVQLLPGIGCFIVALQRMLGNLIAFLIFFLGFVLCMGVIILRVLSYGKIDCMEEVRTSENATYSTFLILLNMLNLKTLEIIQENLAVILHVILVFVGNIMLLNFLIALFSANVTWVDQHKEVIVTVQRICVVMTLDIRLHWILRGPYMWFQSRHFNRRNGRLLLEFET